MDSPQQRIAVIGGAGFIGSVLVRGLLDAGYATTVLDRLDFGVESLREPLRHPAFRFVHGDLRSRKAVGAAVSGAQTVVHLGAVVGDPACSIDKRETVESNYLGAAIVGRAARAAGVERLIFASTCSVYGAAKETVDENSALNPVSLYAHSKIEAEKLLLTLASNDFHPVILRFGTGFGWSPRPRFDLIVNLLTARAYFENKAVILNGDRWRPFVHVADIARAIRKAAEAPTDQVAGQVFNVGDCRMNHRLSDVGKAVTAIGGGSQVTYRSDGDRRDYRVCFEKIQRRLGFECHTTLPEGMREISRGLNAGRVADYRDPKYHNAKMAERRRGSPAV